MKPFLTKIVALLLLFVLSFNVAVPTLNAQGPVPVSDGAIRSKEVGLTIFGITLKGITYDSIMIAISKKLLERMSDNVVAWINNGFNGGPAFATDPAAFFLDVADQIAMPFIEDVGGSALCSPFRNQIMGALQISYRSSIVQRDRYVGSCTISRIVGNFDDFLSGDFSQGGWQGWITMTQNQDSNPYGAMINAQSTLAARIASATGIASKELDWSKGFLSSQNCTGTGSKKVCVTKTPGSIIENQLQKVLGSEISQLELADEFDEIVSALVGQLMGVVFNGGKGLITSNQPRWAGGGYGGNQTNATYQCAPDKDTVTLTDGKADIIWKVHSSNPTSNATYLWTGDAPLSGSTTEVRVAYTSGGLKSAFVTVTETLLASGTASTRTDKTIQCQPDVEIKRFDPIRGFCFPIDASKYDQGLDISGFRRAKVQALRQSDGGRTPESVAWIVFPSGGSGVYDDFLWKINGIGGGFYEDSFKNKTTYSEMAPRVETSVPELRRHLGVSNLYVSPVILPLAKDASGKTINHSVISVGKYHGNKDNPRTASVKIYDREFNEVEGATINCADLDVI